MDNYYSWNAWMQQMMEQMKEQQKIIDQLTQKIEKLQSSDQRKTVIEKIEYHFDQLKIETLEGTLQIGLSPQGIAESEIEDLYKGQTNDQHLNNLMTSHVPKHIDEYVRIHNLPLSSEHREKIISDINKQLPERFQQYQRQHPDLNVHDIVDRLSEEVQSSVVQYLNNYKREDTP
ncbi:spore germination protein GerPC [Halobacillus sp. A1]|uniref:spore germination protein GerPC n=1 Tax=Halobacillus sp. A1 TaxID=2880262 RepID=UPI0020A6C47C|nr:spore germination protein GerPC [Halobacillus sp. A1]MCP3032018.1 spore germination protein GerPC [Halobacillus sp. A1]